MPLALNGYEIGVLTVALIFIAFALVVSLVIPRSRPDFPSKWLGIFVGICVVLFVAQMGAVLAMAELGEEEEVEAVEPTEPGSTEPAPTEPEPTEPEPTEPGTTEPEPTEPPGSSDPLGREVFLANCGSCHTLADAGTRGSIGPNLDESSPDVELVVDRVTNGMGAMPPFEGQLSDEEIQEVAVYVSAATGS